MEKSKGKKIVLLLIILLFVVLIIAGGAYAYIATDLFKSPDMLFKKYLLSGVVEISNFNVGPYKEAYKRMENESTEIKVVGKNEFNFGQLQYSDEDEEQQYLESTITLKLDNKNKNGSVSVDAKLDSEEYLNLELLASKDAVGLYVDGLHDKYITIENRDLKKLAKTFDIDNEMIPDKIPEVSLSKEEREQLGTLISTIISDEFNTIDANSYTQEKYVIEDFDGERFEGNKYVLAISSKRFSEIVTNIVTKFIENDEVNKILKSKFPEELINNVKDSILDGLDIDVQDQTMKISVYVYNGKTLKLDIFANDEMTFEMYILNKEKSSSIQIKNISKTSILGEVSSECAVALRSSFEDNNGEVTYEETTSYDKNDIKALKSKKKEEDAFYDEDEIDEMYRNTTMSAKATITSENDKIISKITTTDRDKNKLTTTYTMNFGDVKVPTLEKDEMVVINDYTQDDFSELMMELVTSGTKIAEEKPNTLVGTMFGFFSGVSSSMPNPLDTPSINDSSNNRISNFEDENKNDIDNNELSLTEINQAKGNIYTSIGNAISSLLRDYRDDLENDSNTDLADYLNVDKIQDEVGTAIKNIEIIDGETIKCEYEDNTYFAKIYINGDNLSIDDLDILYSEDGTLESAK